jgi:hypothetical protein
VASLLLCFSITAMAEKTQICKDIISEIKLLDEDINKIETICPEGNGQHRKYCNNNLSELKETYRKKMNEYFVLEGIKAVQIDMLKKSQAIDKLAAVDFNKSYEIFKDFELSFEKGALVQSSFEANSEGDYIFLDFENEMKSVGVSDYSEDFTKQYIKDRCEVNIDKTYEFCGYYNSLDAKYSGKPDEHSAIIKKLFGLAKASAKFTTGRNKDEITEHFTQYSHYLNVRISNEDGEVKKTKIATYLGDAKIRILRQNMQKFQESTDKDEKGLLAKQINAKAKLIKGDLSQLFGDEWVLTNKSKELKEIKTEVKDKYKPFATELDSIIKTTSDLDNKNESKSAIKKIKREIRKAKELSFLKNQSTFESIVKDVNQSFAQVKCKTTDIDECKENLTKYKDKVCEEDSGPYCEAQKDVATDLFDSIEMAQENSDASELELALKCYENHSKDYIKILACLGKNEKQLGQDLKDHQKELFVLADLINDSETRNTAKYSNLLKDMALFRLRKEKCSHDRNNLEIRSVCTKKVLSALLDDTVITDELGNIVSFIKETALDAKVYRDNKKVKAICELEKYKEKYEAICESKADLKIINKSPPKVFAKSAYNNEPVEIDWAQVNKDIKASTPYSSGAQAAFKGLVGGIGSRLNEGIQEAVVTPQYIDSFGNKMIANRQGQINFEEHQDEIYADMYAMSTLGQFSSSGTTVPILFPEWAGSGYYDFTNFGSEFESNAYPAYNSVYNLNAGTHDISFPTPMPMYTNGSSFVSSDGFDSGTDFSSDTTTGANSAAGFNFDWTE